MNKRREQEVDLILIDGRDAGVALVSFPLVSGLMRVPVFIYLFIYFTFESAYIILCMLPATAGPSTGLRCFGIRWSICSDFYSIFALESSILSLRGGGIIIEVILHISSFMHIYRGVKLDFCSYFFIINTRNNHQGAQLCFNNKCILDFNSPDFLVCVYLLFGLFLLEPYDITPRRFPE